MGRQVGGWVDGGVAAASLLAVMCAQLLPPRQPPGNLCTPPPHNGTLQPPPERTRLLQRLHGLGGVLPRGAAHERKAGEGDHHVDKGLAGAQGVVEELLHGEGEVQAAGKDRDDLGTQGLQLWANR